jgi:hypothetical protein
MAEFVMQNSVVSRTSFGKIDDVIREIIYEAMNTKFCVRIFIIRIARMEELV